ncbi:hypothetical protein Emed_007445 [Eimeria media]
MVSVLIEQVALGKPEDHVHHTLALFVCRADTQIPRLRMQFSRAYDAHHDLCARLRSHPHLDEHFVVTAFLSNLAQDTGRGSHNQVSAADRQKGLQHVAHLGITFGTLARAYTGTGKQRQEDDTTLTLNDDVHAPLPPRDPAEPLCAAIHTPTLCNRARLGMHPRTRSAPTHTRPWATIGGAKCEVTMDKRAGLPVISADILRPGLVFGGRQGRGKNHGPHGRGRVAVKARIGPLKASGSLFFVSGVALAALLGVDFYPRRFHATVPSANS